MLTVAALAGTTVALAACTDKRVQALDTGITRDSALSVMSQDLNPVAGRASDSLPNVYRKSNYLIAGKMLTSPHDILKFPLLNVEWEADYKASPQWKDWATLVQRREKTDPVEKGGWSIYHTSWAGLDMINPAGHPFSAS